VSNKRKREEKLQLRQKTAVVAGQDFACARGLREGGVADGTGSLTNACSIICQGRYDLG
jgi:hypothetical protein